MNNFTTHYFGDNTTAAQILNADFYSPEVVQDAFGWRYSEDQLLRFATSIPDMRTLRKLQSNGFMLMARPPFALSSAGIFDTNLGLFCGAVSPHPFLKTDVVRAGGWLMLRKEAHPLTYGLTTPEQCQKLFYQERMANAAELLYGFVLHSMVRGYPLAQHTRLRTSSRSDQGLSVAIGHGKTGYYINYGRQDWGADDLGVSSVLESDAATV